jgi:hypothetical protein
LRRPLRSEHGHFEGKRLGLLEGFLVLGAFRHFLEGALLPVLIVRE